MTAERIYGMNSDDSIKTRYGGLGAELAVASMFVDGGWNVYTPHRDVGTDFIATKACGDRLILRPVQVKGCYLRSRKDTATYGRRDMELGEQHPEMVLAIPYYRHGAPSLAPICVAFIPLAQLVKQPNGNYRCEPACIRKREILPRRNFRHYFGDHGLALLEQPGWSTLRVDARGVAQPLVAAGAQKWRAPELE